MRRRALGLASLGLALALLAPAEALALASPDRTAAARAAAIDLPPRGGVPDYQLGGAYPPVRGVSIVVRDRRSSAAEGVYTVCYINAFQTQPGERRLWPAGVLLRHNGELVRDPGWPDEFLLDTSTPAKRKRIARIIDRWIRGCAKKGFRAVEFDNLDSYSRSERKLKLRHNVALARHLVRTAHRHGLAAGQKNLAEKSRRLRREARFDFAIAESCARWNECRRYTGVYGRRVIDIEYADETSRARFDRYCAGASSPRSMVLRDHGLVRPGQAGYVFRSC